MFSLKENLVFSGENVDDWREDSRALIRYFKFLGNQEEHEEYEQSCSSQKLMIFFLIFFNLIN